MIYDILTKNESFIEMYRILKEKGIKNNKFFLILYDESLQGVDPHSNDLTDEQKMRIQIEVQRNFWYYVREVVLVPEAGGFTHYQLHLGNLAQDYCMLNNINIIEMLPRQFGKTIGAVIVYSWIFHFTTMNSNMAFGNKQLPDAEENLKRFKDIVNALPKYLLSHTSVKDDIDNVQYIKCKSNNNTIRLLKPGGDALAADKAGRGLTLPICWFDEFSYLKYNDIIYEAAVPAISKASERAKVNGVPYGKLITTTPSTLDDPAGAFLHSMIESAIPFDENWYDMDIDEVKWIIKTRSKNDFVYIEYSYQQLGRGEDWFEEQCRALGWNMFKIKRELKLEWMYASNESPFSEEQLDAISRCVKDPLYEFTIDNIHRFYVMYPLSNIYKKSWIIAIDIATGLSLDSSAITVIDPASGKPAVVYKSNTIQEPELVDLVVKLVDTYFPNAVIVPEHNAVGIPFISQLLKTKVANQVYYEVKTKEVENTIDMSAKMGKANKVKKETRVYGVITNKDSRKIMTDEILNSIVNEAPDRINNKMMFSEIKTLIRDKNGRIDHRPRHA